MTLAVPCCCQAWRACAGQRQTRLLPWEGEHHHQHTVWWGDPSGGNGQVQLAKHQRKMALKIKHGPQEGHNQTRGTAVAAQTRLSQCYSIFAAPRTVLAHITQAATDTRSAELTHWQLAHEPSPITSHPIAAMQTSQKK